MAISRKGNVGNIPAPANLSYTRCHFERRRSRSREIPYGRNETNRTRLPQNTRPRWLSAEKSHAGETRSRVHDYPKKPAGAGSAPVGRRNDRIRFREIPTVTSFPRNDILNRRMRRLIMFICIKSKRTPVPPCHCERRRSRAWQSPGREDLLAYTTTTKHLPAVAHRNCPRRPIASLRRKPPSTGTADDGGCII